MILLIGILLCNWISIASDFCSYPSKLADIYREKQKLIVVPGSSQVELLRPGAYGIYYEYSFLSDTSAKGLFPPSLDCSLKSADGNLIRAVPDYVPTNRYWSRTKGGIGVLIMSLTVEQPGTYMFTCLRQGGEEKPELTVALGPNYMWELFRMIGNFSWDLLKILGVFYCALLSGLVLLFLPRLIDRIPNDKDC